MVIKLYYYSSYSDRNIAIINININAINYSFYSCPFYCFAFMFKFQCSKCSRMGLFFSRHVISPAKLSRRFFFFLYDSLKYFCSLVFVHCCLNLFVVFVLKQSDQMHERIFASNYYLFNTNKHKLKG